MLVYLASFLFIAIFWVNHFFLFQKLEKINQGTVVLF